MKKILFVLAALMFAAPALAAVDITCTHEGSGVVAVYYDAGTEANSVRAFALDISISDGNIVDVNDTDNLDFWVNPGTIQIADGVVTSEGTSVAPGGDAGSCSSDPNCRTIEMATLYVGANEPDANGLLLKFTVDTDCCVTITENATRGEVVSETIVDEPAYDVTVNAPSGSEFCVSLDVCGTCPMDTSGWEGYGIPDGYIGPEDIGNCIATIIPCSGAGYYCAVTSETQCMDTAGWEGYGIPDGYIGPEDVGHLIATVIPCSGAGYYCTCP